MLLHRKLLMLKYQQWTPQHEPHEWTPITWTELQANRDEGILIVFTFPCLLCHLFEEQNKLNFHRNINPFLSSKPQKKKQLKRQDFFVCGNGCLSKKSIEPVKLLLEGHCICCMFELLSHGKQSFREEEVCTPESLMLLWSRSASHAQTKTWKEPSQQLPQPLSYMVIVSGNTTASYSVLKISF